MLLSPAVTVDKDRQNAAWKLYCVLEMVYGKSGQLYDDLASAAMHEHGQTNGRIEQADLQA